MLIAIIHDDQQPPIQLDLQPSTDIATLKSLLHVELNIMPIRQKITLLGKPTLDIQDALTLEALGVQQHDVFLIEDRQSPTNKNDLLAAQAAEIIKSLTSDPARLSQLSLTQPQFAQAVRNNDVSAIVQRLQQHYRSTDLLSASTQQMLFDRLRHEQIEQNRETACEVLPEAFGDVVMLYVNIEVNGHKVMAFVDSGAQSTIMSEDCAKRCGLDRLTDRRYQGTATGIGKAKLLGRVHIAQIKCGEVFLPASFIIIEGQQMDVLIGLDLLRRHQCQIDLKENRLYFGGSASVQFLPESEILKNRSQTAIVALTGSDNNLTASTGSVAPGYPTASTASAQFSSTGSGLFSSSLLNPTPFSAVLQSSATVNPATRPHPAVQPPAPVAAPVQIAPPVVTQIRLPAQGNPGPGPSNIHPGPGPSNIHPGPGPSNIHPGPGPSNIHPGPGPSHVPPVLNVAEGSPQHPFQGSRRIHTQNSSHLNLGGKLIEEAKLKQLCELGFDRERALQVLRQCRGNVELAAMTLFQSTASA